MELVNELEAAIDWQAFQQLDQLLARSDDVSPTDILYALGWDVDGAAKGNRKFYQRFGKRWGGERRYLCEVLDLEREGG